MSVDNYLSHLMKMFSSRLKDTLAKPLAKFFYFGKEDSDVEHFVQSEYARQFVKLNGIADKKIHMVEDYLNQTFLTRAAQVDLSRKKISSLTILRKALKWLKFLSPMLPILIGDRLKT
ncbi:MAG: hypothetical protein IJP42_07515 [Selenomonadaceae bacterium]|nr:hypothetical protein [Selenomonadaceae bacterium]MBR0103843.1 hypothetical protein [Selenomonadaceae bacterium]